MLPPSASAAWNQPVGGPSPINQSDAGNVFDSLSLAEVGGVPYIAWDEGDGSSEELRVARFNGSTGTWEQPWTGVTDTYGGINQSTDRQALAPNMASIGGIPHASPGPSTTARTGSCGSPGSTALRTPGSSRGRA